MDVEALTKRLRERADNQIEDNTKYIQAADALMFDAADALAALSADLSMANAAAETARNACDHWEARVKELERERDAKNITVDIGAAVAALQSSPELASMIMQMVAPSAAKDVADAEARATALAAEVERLASGLRDVCNPLGKLRRDAEAQGAVLSGMAYQIANDPEFIKGIARAALEGKDNG